MNSAQKPIIGVHLDLKYLMPSKRYLLQWVRQLAELGINTLLLEYEDKFPFQKRPYLRDAQAFTPEELREFLSTARQAGLRVIPLVQSLSHLEFALAHDELADLREAPNVPTQICPSNPAAVAFVNELIDEILTFHGPDEWVHIGGDESWFMGSCPTCQARLAKSDKMTFWADHMRPLIQRVQAAGKRVILWDDTFWPKPEAAGTVDLPRGVVLGSWNYSERKFLPDGNLDKMVRTYQQAGIEVLGTSCVNWGVLTPMHDHCMGNAVGWAQEVQRRGLLGVINSAWSCFHVPVPMEMLYVAGAAAAFDATADPLSESWQTAFLADQYGCDAAAVPQALRQLGTAWEQSIAGYDRPIAPIVYGYMDMVLHYPGSQEERRRRGGYPLDWAEVDFNALLAKKIQLLRAVPDSGAIRKKLDDLESAYGAAQPVLADLARRAKRQQPTAELLACFAEMKLWYTRAIRLLVFGEGDGAAIRKAIVPLRARTQQALTPFYEELSCHRMDHILMAPMITALR